jgi:RNA polymerase sigma-70 factor (ECF subfamily)
MDTGTQAPSAEFQDRLRAFVRRRVQSDADADDVVQDVLTKLVTNGPEPSGSVHAWLFTVARHAIIDRSRTRREHADLGAIELAEEPPEGEGAAGELARCLGPMMAALSDDDRLVLTRVDLGGESQADFARELGVSASGLKSRVQRARSRLRAVLESCCSVARDQRGRPIEYERRAGTACPCRGAGSACGGG